MPSQRATDDSRLSKTGLREDCCRISAARFARQIPTVCGCFCRQRTTRRVLPGGVTLSFVRTNQRLDQRCQNRCTRRAVPRLTCCSPLRLLLRFAFPAAIGERTMFIRLVAARTGRDLTRLNQSTSRIREASGKTRNVGLPVFCLPPSGDGQTLASKTEVLLLRILVKTRPVSSCNFRPLARFWGIMAGFPAALAGLAACGAPQSRHNRQVFPKPHARRGRW